MHLLCAVASLKNTCYRGFNLAVFVVVRLVILRQLVGVSDE